ncbi:MAG TPA: pantetheine-phosphate adenylyltransferase [Candidatus Goldiibacteriota bacterium]|mgnify:CR=1 FL=1|jgi:pantetheine-phosphate adenylyltransferase|nr:pantetheine-phosphate adenylyltransferase [Candidatus Goldiibacteriota bacterium]HPI03989.1 pantetheine-phosphate adenylyltransferase [Candidatus Goldiibacteriota bacterium]HPN65363.1 pantetheine-phosphate adenylyltransferase [Candidatus Goldiibacteriota bacterium]HRQ43187.1 pantetheine-phosphate adenylyltransferase [Candidatus Goldiibacteriota bacterium]
MKKTAVYPGTFDPITNGHIDIVKRASKMFDTVVIAVSKSEHKKPLFSVEERVEMAKKAVKGIKNIKVECYSGLLADYLKSTGRNLVIRGIRVISDFEYEFQLALLNKKLNPEAEMIYLMPDEKYLYISSSAVKEIAVYGGKTELFVPAHVTKALKLKFSR